ncbi:MAG: enoyl-CoA hydratase/isomerase family protein [Pseudomonadales bacterium]|nr:enoyl-CoA hydratase/isomerase family protein [Pseudomonadales bacterium]
MKSINLEKTANQYSLKLLGEGKFTNILVDDLNEALDQIEQDTGDLTLVVTGDGKNFSQGYDIDYLASCGDKMNDFIEESLRVFSRLLSLGVPSVAAVNGHAFGSGAMLALCCDFRCMREDRGYFCLPEIDLGMNLHPYMSALLKSKLSMRVVRESILSGKRYAGPEALTKEIVDSIASENSLLDESSKLLLPYTSKNQATYSSLKKTLNNDILSLLK